MILANSKKNIKHYLLFIFIILGVLLFQLEIAARLYFNRLYQMPVFYTNDLFYFFYPELNNIKYINKKKINIVCLGGSVLGVTTIKNIDFEERLTDGLKDKGDYSVTNLSTSSRTSLDSFYKLEWLIKNKIYYDMVVFYHAINELRFNNCPDNVWQTDYSHYPFYRDINIIRKTPEFLNKYCRAYFFIFHFYQEYICHPENPDFGENEKSMPRPDWLKYGGDIKTRESFEKNINNIIEICNKNNIKLILPLFATCFPETYLNKDFLNKKYPYSRDGLGFPVDLWGEFSNVMKGIAVHNRILLSMKDKKNVKVIEATLEMDNKFPFFTDICHFSRLGYDKFISVLSKAIKEF